MGTRHVHTLEGLPTGTAYILLFDDNDNAIVLLGGANQEPPLCYLVITPMRQPGAAPMLPCCHPYAT